MIRLVFFALLLTFASPPVYACLAPSFEHHHAPSCTITLPEADERVFFVRASGETELADHHLGAADRPTQLVNVLIEPNDKRNYLMLSAREQTIWQFFGDVSSISRVVVLGATEVGADAAGVIGIPEDRVEFTSPSLRPLSRVEINSCTRISRTCVPEQWRERAGSPRLTLYPEPAQSQLFIDRVAMHWEWRRHMGEPSIFVVEPERAGAVIAVSPEQIVSPGPAEPYVSSTR